MGYPYDTSETSAKETMDSQSKSNLYPSQEFLDALVQKMLKESLGNSTSRDERVVEFKHPKELLRLLELNLNKPTSDDNLLRICEGIMKYSVKTAHPRFCNQLYGGLDQYGLAGAWMIEALNTAQFTYEVSPALTLVEMTVVQKMISLIGYKDGDGIFCPGGSISNMYAISAARHKMFPDSKYEGMPLHTKLCILTSEQSHFSITKGAMFMGIGKNNVISVKSDEDGKMNAKSLEEEIERVKNEGRTPFLVVATAGTTVLGAFDPIEEMADICKKHQLWLHVDAAWGGGVLLSRKHRHLMKGVERSDSVTWNPHKMMGAPQQCSAFITSHPTIMREAHSTNALYLYQTDKFYDISYDLGDKSIQCGRKADALKVWMMWKQRGDKQYEKDIDYIFEMAQYFSDVVKKTEGFELLLEPELLNINFYYVPPSLRNQPRNTEWKEKLAKVAPKIKEKMTLDGSMLVTYQSDLRNKNFFRMIISNFETTKEDVEFIISNIARYGQDIVIETEASVPNSDNKVSACTPSLQRLISQSVQRMTPSEESSQKLVACVTA